jgi:predicted RNA polymerase sigma factor
LNEELTDDRIIALQACLSGLKPEQQQLLELIHDQGLSCEEAAEVLEIKAAACRQRLSRLHRSIRTCAEERLKNLPGTRQQPQPAQSASTSHAGKKSSDTARGSAGQAAP